MKSEYLSIKDYYFQILMMGLRLIDGIDLRIKKNHDAYRFYQKKLQHIKIVNHHLCAENVNVLDTILLDIL
jgi:oxygen-independent coproporphyrinogen-3 oxidase